MEPRGFLPAWPRRLWTDLEPEEAPVVLVVGTETETGQVVLRPEGVVCGEGSERGGVPFPFETGLYVEPEGGGGY